MGIGCRGAAVMARKTKIITVADDSRDNEKIYLLTEMPASQAEKWAARAFLAIAKAGVEIPDDLVESGLIGFAAFGLKALGGIPYAELVPLLDEMFSCVTCIPDAEHPEVVRRLVESDIEEISTRLMLRKEIFALHVNFSIPVAR